MSDKRKWMNKNGITVLMVDMDESYLRTAHLSICIREVEMHNKLNTLHRLREELEEVAQEREIKLDEPDVRFPHPRWGQYLAQDRKIKSTPVDEVDSIKTEQVVLEKENSSTS
jgi:hypothetical protein